MPGTETWFPSLVHLPSFRFLPRLPGAQTGHCHPNHTPLRWDKRHPPRCIEMWISMIWWSNHTTPYLELDRFRENAFGEIPRNNTKIWLKYNSLISSRTGAGWLVGHWPDMFFLLKNPSWGSEPKPNIPKVRKAINQYLHGKAYGLCKCKVFFRGGAGSSGLAILTVHHAFPWNYWNVGKK